MLVRYNFRWFLIGNLLERRREYHSMRLYVFRFSIANLHKIHFHFHWTHFAQSENVLCIWKQTAHISFVFFLFLLTFNCDRLSYNVINIKLLVFSRVSVVVFCLFARSHVELHQKWISWFCVASKLLWRMRCFVFASSNVHFACISMFFLPILRMHIRISEKRHVYRCTKSKSFWASFFPVWFK